MKSVMRNQFSSVPTVGIQRSSFNRDCGYKTVFDAGYLIPIYWDEVLPGDTHTVRMSSFGRLSTPIHPIMDNLHLDFFFFFVPNRLLWDNWEKFNGAQEKPADSTDYLVPQVVGIFSSGTMFDYFGMPTEVANLSVNAFYPRAYNLIWNEWFRDQNLQDSVTVPLGDGPDTPTQYVLKRRGKRHDYFTSCLPWPQKDNGNPVLLPLGDSAPIAADLPVGGGNTYSIENTDGKGRLIQTGAISGDPISTDGIGASTPLIADLTNATASTINDLRQAFQVQRMFEKDARGGTRYVEVLKNHFQVTSPDFRLQRPEYLGGGSQAVNINPVAQTSSSSYSTGDAGTPQGNLAAFGTVSGGGIGFTKSFVEHGVIIGLASLRADLTYQQGLDRIFSRQTRFDYYWPSLANLGEQAVLNKEIFADGTANDELVFGYQERWAEYRYKPSRITGQLRSNHGLTLHAWHLSQDFANLPVLGNTFIEDNPPIDRVVAVPSNPHVIFDSYFQVRSARPMPVNSVPGMIDHF